MSYVPSSTSINTGMRLFWRMGLSVVGKPHAVVMTSSPGLSLLLPSLGEVKVDIASRLAEDPEFVSKQCFTPRNSANIASNCFA